MIYELRLKKEDKNKAIDIIKEFLYNKANALAQKQKDMLDVANIIKGV